MRTRWQWQWRQPEFDDFFCGSLLWGLIGCVVFAIVCIASPQSEHLKTSGQVALVVWLVPLALECVVVGLFYTVKVLCWLLHHPPMRRVTEPLPDLRQRSD